MKWPWAWFYTGIWVWGGVVKAWKCAPLFLSISLRARAIISDTFLWPHAGALNKGCTCWKLNQTFLTWYFPYSKLGILYWLIGKALHNTNYSASNHQSRWRWSQISPGYFASVLEHWHCFCKTCSDTYSQLHYKDEKFQFYQDVSLPNHHFESYTT